MSTLVEPEEEAVTEHDSRFHPSLGRFDIILMSIAATLSIDTIGQIAANGGAQAFTWTAVIALTFMLPYGLIMAELGSSFPQEGGPYVWVRLAMGRFHAALSTMLYWVTNPVWLGGSLAFLAMATWSDFIVKTGSGSFGDYAFKLIFIWAAIVAAISSLRYGKWLLNIGAIVKVGLVVIFVVTLVAYASQHGVHGYAAGDFSPTTGGFLASAPVILFAVVGFEAQNGAAEEMRNPKRDVPIGIGSSALVSALCYLVPIFGILLVLPSDKISGAAGFMDAIRTVFSVYGGAATGLLKLVAVLFIFVLFTQGAAWMIASDRVQAIAGADGTFPRYFGVFSKNLGTPLRVNILSGVVATVFTVVATKVTSGSAGAAFEVVLNVAVSTLLLSYLWIFLAAWILRRKYPHAERPYRVPGGRIGMSVATFVIYAWVAIGSWTTVCPDTIERLFGVGYDFEDSWGVSRLTFEVFTLGTLAVITICCLVGYLVGRRTDTGSGDFSAAIVAELEANEKAHA